MAISGTGTGPFTITGTENTLNIYNFVVGQNSANASKNSDNTSFDFNVVLNVGNGSTTTVWNSSEEMVRIDANSFIITENATLNIGLANPARGGSYWRWQMTGNDQFIVRGTIKSFASRLFASHRVNSNNGAVGYFEESVIAFLDSFTNGDGTTNPDIQYVRCFIAGASAVAVKLGGTVALQGTKISGANFAFQPLPKQGASTTYIVNDYVGQGNTNDVVPNISNSGQLNIIGAFDGAGVPRTSLITAAHASGNIVRLQWKYNLFSFFNNAVQSGTNVRIRNLNNTIVFTGQTNGVGAIPEQILTRFEYINSSTGTARFPYQVKLRKYDRTSQELVYNADNHTTQQAVHLAVPYITLTEAQALALTGITLTPDLAPQKITNGTFDTATGWTIPSGSISGGKANITNATMMISQPSASWVAGKTYQVTFDYTKTNATGGFRIGLGTNDGQNAFWEQNVGAGSGTITTTFVAGSQLTGFYLGASNAVFSGSLDNISVREVGANISSGTIAVSGARTIAELWQFYRAWIAQTLNFDTEDTWNYDGTTLNIGAWTISGIENLSNGAITTSTATAGGAFSIAVNGTVNQATPTNLVSTAKATTLVYNTNTATSVTYATGTQIGTVRNDGTGIVTIAGGSITDYTDAQINYLDSNITAVGITSATIYQTEANRDTGANPGATFTTSLNFKYGSVVNGVTMQNTVYLRVVVGSVTLFAQITLVLGSNTLDFGVQGQLSAINAKVTTTNDNLPKVNRNVINASKFKTAREDFN